MDLGGVGTKHLLVGTFLSLWSSVTQKVSASLTCACSNSRCVRVCRIQLVKKYEPYPVEGPFNRLTSPQAEGVLAVCIAHTWTCCSSCHAVLSSLCCLLHVEPHPNGSRKRMGTTLVSGPPFKPEFVYEMLSRIESSLSTQVNNSL